MSKRSSQKGYTLLELLAAFSLLLILAVLVFDGLKFGNRVWAKTTENFQQQQETLVVTSLLKDWIENTQAIEAPSGDHLVFSGTRRKIEFIAPLNPGSHSADFYEITFEFRSFESDLIARWKNPETRMDGERVLFEQIKTFELSYFPESGEPQKGWQNSWENKKTLPALVRVAIEIEEDGKVRSFNFITKTRIDWGADCVFNIAAKTCKGPGS